MINCIIIDDEPMARNLLADYIEKVPSLQLAASTSSGLEALDLLKKHQTDLIFLDIQMPDISGIDFLKALKTRPHVIFTTAHAEFALQGYELDVIDYLLKPFDFGRFLKAVNKASEIISSKSSPSPQQESVDYMFIKDGHQLIKVPFRDILYISGLKDYVKIILKDSTIISLQTFKSLLEHLPSDTFVRIHNSYIISLDHIKAVTKSKVKVNDTMLPIGQTFKHAFLERLNKMV